MGFLGKFRHDRLFLLFLIILVVLGMYLRFSNYDEIGYTHDSILTVTGAIAWFYPYPHFPGLIYLGPPLGNMIIGTGCMVSNEDFSGVLQVGPKFSPNIPILMGQSFVNAEFHCKAPNYLFGLIFLLVLSLLAIFLFKNYYALFSIAFFTFSQFILKWGRIMSVDMIFYVFTFTGLIFLWKSYEAEKSSKKENTFFIFCFVFLGFAGATKFSAGVYFLFAFLLFMGKYWQEIKLLIKNIFKTLKLDLANKISTPAETKLRPFIIKGIFYFITYVFVLLIPYKLNPQHLYNIYTGFKRIAPNVSAMRLNSNIFPVINEFLIKINTLDLLIFLFSIYIFIRLIFKKQKQKREKFILYLVFLFLFTTLFFESVGLLFRVAIPLLLSIVFLMGLVFSHKEYSIFKLFKIPIEKRKKIFFIFLIIYILYSALITVPHSPYYFRSNEIICIFEREQCDQILLEDFNLVATKQTMKFLGSILKENETYRYQEGEAPQIYLRPNDPMIYYQLFDLNLNKQLGRSPTLAEQVQYFHPEGRDLRYYVENRWYGTNTEEIEILKKEYQPNYIVKLDNKDVMRIYDLFNLTKKGF
ncbi:hypothetical protein CMI37_24425 [Candidatus Pacearchaeota archaeon]|nr:hypothetical protein [Candidatus Pacearchaeota archaeon]